MLLVYVLRSYTYEPSRHGFTFPVRGITNNRSNCCLHMHHEKISRTSPQGLGVLLHPLAHSCRASNIVLFLSFAHGAQPERTQLSLAVFFGHGFERKSRNHDCFLRVRQGIHISRTQELTDSRLRHRDVGRWIYLEARGSSLTKRGLCDTFPIRRRRSAGSVSWGVSLGCVPVVRASRVWSRGIFITNNAVC